VSATDGAVPSSTGARVHSILIVDDDPVIRAALQGVFEDEGFAVLTAANGREAIQLAAGAPPDLVVLDITLPILDGYEVATAIRAAHGPGIPILAITADGDAADKAARAGAYAFLAKPFELDDIVRTVRSRLHD
jgi:CheY-like chemotaxis protein